MADKERESDLRGPSKGVSRGAVVTFSDEERELLEEYAALYGLTFEEAVDEASSRGLARRVRKRTGKGPSAAVLRFRRDRK